MYGYNWQFGWCGRDFLADMALRFMLCNRLETFRCGSVMHLLTSSVLVNFRFGFQSPYPNLGVTAVVQDEFVWDLRWAQLIYFQMVCRIAWFIVFLIQTYDICRYFSIYIYMCKTFSQTCKEGFCRFAIRYHWSSKTLPHRREAVCPKQQ